MLTLGLLQLRRLRRGPPPPQRLPLGILGLLRYAIREWWAHESCEDVQLWVDVARVGARSLFAKCAFEVKEEAPDFMLKGGTGIRMVLNLDSFKESKLIFSPFNLF
jgi:hypothetical protein